MHFELTASEAAYRDEVRAFVHAHLESEIVERLGLLNSPARRAFMRTMGEAGYLQNGWPSEYGGRPGTTMMRIILNEELAYAGAPNIGISILSVGQALLKHGSEELKQELLPRVLRSEILFAFGYTEPHGGSDLAGLRTTAVRDGEHYVLKGVKKFITPAHYADFMWTAVRTDSEVERHAGISLFCVPLGSPGIELRALESVGQWRTNEVTLRDVRVPARYLVGKLNGGWHILSSALSDERLYPFKPLQRSVEQLETWAGSRDQEGHRPADDPAVRAELARLHADLDAAESLFLRQVTGIVAGRDTATEAAMNKVANTVLDKRIQNLALSLMGEDGLVQAPSAESLADGVFERDYRVSIVGPIAGGSNEIQKNIIAKRHLSL